MFPFGEPVDVLTANQITDPYSNDVVDDWGAPSAVTHNGIAVEPRPSSEPVQDARNAVTSGFTLYGLPPGSVTPQNRVRVRGQIYDVLGEPAEWKNPYTGWEPGLVVQVGRTEG